MVDAFWNFEGRIGRKNWWLYSIGSWLLHAAIATVAMLLPLGLPVVMLSLLVSELSIHTRRLHDRDQSGWWCLVFLIPFIGSLFMLVTLGFLASDPRPNQYGNGEQMALPYGAPAAGVPVYGVDAYGNRVALAQTPAAYRVEPVQPLPRLANNNEQDRPSWMMS